MFKHKFSEFEAAIRNLAEKIGFFDREILENDYVNFNAGKHIVSVRMKAEDLKNVVDGIVF